MSDKINYETTKHLAFTTVEFSQRFPKYFATIGDFVSRSHIDTKTGNKVWIERIGTEHGDIQVLDLLNPRFAMPFGINCLPVPKIIGYWVQPCGYIPMIGGYTHVVKEYVEGECLELMMSKVIYRKYCGDNRETHIFELNKSTVYLETLLEIIGQTIEFIQFCQQAGWYCSNINYGNIIVVKEDSGPSSEPSSEQGPNRVKCYFTNTHSFIDNSDRRWRLRPTCKLLSQLLDKTLFTPSDITVYPEDKLSYRTLASRYVDQYKQILCDDVLSPTLEKLLRIKCAFIMMGSGIIQRDSLLETFNNLRYDTGSVDKSTVMYTVEYKKSVDEWTDETKTKIKTTYEPRQIELWSDDIAELATQTRQFLRTKAAQMIIDKYCADPEEVTEIIDFDDEQFLGGVMDLVLEHMSPV